MLTIAAVATGLAAVAGIAAFLLVPGGDAPRPVEDGRAAEDGQRRNGGDPTG
jgi:hypothetical protein